MSPPESWREIWAERDAVGFLQAIADGEIPRAPHTEHVGLVIEKVDQGAVELSWEPDERICNPAGIVHGGYVSVVIDDAAGLSSASLGERFVPMLTLDLHVEFLRPILPNVRYTVRGVVVHAGRTRNVCDALVEDPDGRLVARGGGSFVQNRAFAQAAADRAPE